MELTCPKLYIYIWAQNEHFLNYVYIYLGPKLTCPKLYIYIWALVVKHMRKSENCMTEKKYRNEGLKN